MSSTQSKCASPVWLNAFLEGESDGFEACYREYFDVVDAAVGSVLDGADRDTAVHEVFYKLITRPDVRRTFSGRSLSGWLRAMARNHAVDFARRRGRELTGSDVVDLVVQDTAPHPEGIAGARQIIERLRKRLPGRLQGVFEKRFIEQRTQREAAAELGIPRTTLVYHETQIRRQIHKLIAEIDL
jgi:RNA polymerase sigma-70 factor (ECF subfamily)